MTEPEPGDRIKFWSGPTMYEGKFLRRIIVWNYPYYEIEFKKIVIQVPYEDIIRDKMV